MPEFKKYRRTGLTKMRPYVVGEDLTGISVTEGVTPKQGDYIAVSLTDSSDQWLVTEEYFQSTGFEEVVD